MSATSAKEQLAFLTRNAAEVVPEAELMQKLERSASANRPLRVKLGLDPTAGDVTLGWAVVLRKLREFQDLGHTPVLIVGDLTAQVGDPSGKSEARPRMDSDAVRSFGQRLLMQFWKILDRDRTEVRYNSEWLAPLGMQDILRLTSSYTVARMLERDDFAKRLADGKPITIMEFLYPLLQGQDSVAIGADVELGGTDQKFNLLVGRELQRDAGQEPQVAFTMPLLIGLDGANKMSQSLGNYVGIEDPSDEMFEKLMSIPDELIEQYSILCAPSLPDDQAMSGGVLKDVSGPDANAAKRRMARAVVALYQGEIAAAAAEDRFDRVHRDRELPEHLPEVHLPAAIATREGVWLPRLLVELGLVDSNSEGRRQIEAGGIRVDGELVTDPKTELAVADLPGKVLQVGRRKFVRIARPGGN